jgi:hypothetical protein
MTACVVQMGVWMSAPRRIFVTAALALLAFATSACAPLLEGSYYSSCSHPCGSCHETHGKVDAVLGILELVVAVADVAAEVPAEPSMRGSAPLTPDGIPVEQQARADAQRAARAQREANAARQALASMRLPSTAGGPLRP